MAMQVHPHLTVDPETPSFLARKDPRLVVAAEVRKVSWSFKTADLTLVFDPEMAIQVPPT